MSGENEMNVSAYGDAVPARKPNGEVQLARFDINDEKERIVEIRRRLAKTQRAGGLSEKQLKAVSQMAKGYTEVESAIDVLIAEQKELLSMAALVSNIGN